MSLSHAFRPSLVTSVLESTFRVVPEIVKVLDDWSKPSTRPVSWLRCDALADADAVSPPLRECGVPVDRPGASVESLWPLAPSLGLDRDCCSVVAAPIAPLCFGSVPVCCELVLLPAAVPLCCELVLLSV
jgi:hypothetical protein